MYPFTYTKPVCNNLVLRKQKRGIVSNGPGIRQKNRLNLVDTDVDQKLWMNLLESMVEYQGSEWPE